jgi:hypothetical protein
LPTTPAAQLIVRDSVIDWNGTGSNGGGIQVNPGSGGSAGVLLERVKFAYNVTAVVLNSGTGGITAIMKDNVVDSSLNNGVLAFAGAQPLTLAINNSTFSLNVGAALQSSGAKSTVTIDNSTFTGNQTGLSTNGGGSILSYQNNRIFDNGTNGAPTGSLGLK